MSKHDVKAALSKAGKTSGWWFLGTGKERQPVYIPSVYCSQVSTGFQSVRAGMDTTSTHSADVSSWCILSYKRRRKRAGKVIGYACSIMDVHVMSCTSNHRLRYSQV